MSLIFRNIRMRMQTSLLLNRAKPLLVALLCVFYALRSYAKDPIAEDLFRDSVIPNLHLQLSSEAIASLSRSPKKYVRANVREGLKSYTNVAVHLKGGPGSFRQIGQDKPAFT